ncbi:MAG: PQQ-binding-like beta-propeller repeat protein, partial [Verrucomicrobiae bacterium]|nr:PQQ-binding-like beta-propeller repeat protein [Verrucomicrobiae bacterium]
MQRRFLLPLLCTFLCLPWAAPADEAADILKATGITGGFVVHLGSGDGTLTAALKASDSIQVHGLDRDGAKVDAARTALRTTGSYGPVSFERLDGDHLPYITGMVNLVVAEADLGISDEEIMRVIAPRGVAYAKQSDGSWKKTVKPVPAEIDDWTHYLHDSGGNAVAHDSVVGPPRRMQWVGSPRWSRHHDRMASMSALVSAKGRLIYVMDEGSRISIQLPSKWTLIARDAFNGMPLWKREIPNWQDHLWPLKSGPTQLARRLVAVEDRVFCTMGIVAPVSVIDATNGETIHELAGSEGTEEVIVSNGTVYVIAMKESRELANFLPQLNTGDQGRVAKEYAWNELPRVVMAFDAESGKELWHLVSKVSPLTLAADNERMYFHDGDKVIALDGKTGKEAWTTEKADRRDVVNFNFGPKLVVTGGKVIFAGGDRKMHTYDATTGKALWEAAHARGGYQSPEDLLVMNGLVWSAALTSGGDDGVFRGIDLNTGEVKAEFPPTVETYWFHHRCYIAKATDRFIMPSRTGIEFVDPKTEQWEIHHWVRGGCLYGVMPCNGLTYAPPHNCACYPEAKLYGFNALAPASEEESKALPDSIQLRLEKGTAFGSVPTAKAGAESDWPTFRHDNSRSGTTSHAIAADKLKEAWTTDLGGRLSSVVVANGLAFVSQIDEHTVHALDATNGEKIWSYTAGGRVDSPPTIHQGAVIFGSADGWIYCLRAEDGTLAWRFRASPRDRRMMAFEQLESVWPVHGNILIESGVLYAVAGRSNFLDGGLRMYRIDPKTGELLGETIIDEKDPETGENIQNRLQTLQMPVGLPDILSASGGYVYMRSQQFDLDGNRLAIGPNSGDAATNAAVQAGDGRHLFAPMSFLDDTWFHRSYWVYGKSFSGGHNGYYQAAKNTPSGRLIVFDDEKVFGFGRKPEYLKWTTTIEHQLFSAPIDAPEGALSAIDDKEARRGKGAAAKKGAAAGGPSMITFDSTKSLNPAEKALSVEAWVKTTNKNGVVIARGGPADGFALTIQGGKPSFLIRSKNELTSIASETDLGNDWTHLAGVLGEDKSMKLYVNGKLAAEGKSTGLIATDPKQGMEIGADNGSAVGDYKAPMAFKGLIDEVLLFFGELSAEEIASHAVTPGDAPAANAELVLAVTFENSDAGDSSGKNNHGTIVGKASVASDAPAGKAMEFTGGGAGGGGNAQPSGTLVKFDWTQDIPLLVRAMVKTSDALIAVGPPDLINEEETFKKLTEGDPEVLKVLADQDAALEGSQGAVLWAVSTATGEKLRELKLPALPVWDGMAVAGDRLFIATTDGKVL